MRPVCGPTFTSAIFLSPDATEESFPAVVVWIAGTAVIFASAAAAVGGALLFPPPSLVLPILAWRLALAELPFRVKLNADPSPGRVLVGGVCLLDPAAAPVPFRSAVLEGLAALIVLLGSASRPSPSGWSSSNFCFRACDLSRSSMLIRPLLGADVSGVPNDSLERSLGGWKRAAASFASSVPANCGFHCRRLQEVTHSRTVSQPRTKEKKGRGGGGSLPILDHTHFKKVLQIVIGTSCSRTVLLCKG